MLSIFAVLVLGAFPYHSAAQTAATCLPTGFDWSFNSLHESPCDIAAALAGACIGGGFVLAPLPTGFVYLGPTATNQTPCRCSSVYYSLLSACAVCQSRNFIPWSQYKPNCTVVYDQVFPEPIPSGITVPHYAYLDVDTADNFNSTLAQAAGGSESSSIPSSTGGPSTIPGSTNTPVASGKKSNAGGIAGGVVGGLVALAAIAGLVFWLLRRKRRPAPPSAIYEPPMTSQNLISTPSSHYPATGSRVYDPNDPSTFPKTNEPAGYYTPPPQSYSPYSQQYSSPSPQSHNAPMMPNYTGTSAQPSFPRPQYTGAPEL